MTSITINTGGIVLGQPIVALSAAQPSLAADVVASAARIDDSFILEVKTLSDQFNIASKAAQPIELPHGLINFLKQVGLRLSKPTIIGDMEDLSAPASAALNPVAAVVKHDFNPRDFLFNLSVQILTKLKETRYPQYPEFVPAYVNRNLSGVGILFDASNAWAVWKSHFDEVILKHLIDSFTIWFEQLIKDADPKNFVASSKGKQGIKLEYAQLFEAALYNGFSAPGDTVYLWDKRKDASTYWREYIAEDILSGLMTGITQPQTHGGVAIAKKPTSDHPFVRNEGGTPKNAQKIPPRGSRRHFGDY